MTVIATDTTGLSQLVKQVYAPEIGYCTEVVTVNGPAATLAIGTALGKVTATGKYKVSIQTAVDGSEVPVALVHTKTVVALNTDTKVLAFIRGPMSVSKAGIVLDASYDTGAEQLAVYASLESKGIQVLDAV